MALENRKRHKFQNSSYLKKVLTYPPCIQSFIKIGQPCLCIILHGPICDWLFNYKPIALYFISVVYVRDRIFYRKDREGEGVFGNDIISSSKVCVVFAKFQHLNPKL